jgi:hypothetical protein
VSEKTENALPTPALNYSAGVISLRSAGRPRRVGRGISSLSREWIIGLFAITAVVATLQRGVFDQSHTTFPIFRQSFHHLVAGTDLYAAYPTEQGDRPQDLFKYSPTAALLFAPFALPPFGIGLLLWNLAGAALIYLAIDRLLPKRRATMAMLLVYPSLLASLQSSSSNALIAACIVLAFSAFERERPLRGAAVLAIGALFKLFPLAGLSLAVFHRKRTRLALMFCAVSVALVALPLIVTTPHALALQYRSWWGILGRDAADLEFGQSIMALARSVFRVTLPNWPLQLAGTLVLLAPLVRLRRQAAAADFRLRALCSVLVYVVVFNHQAEFQSSVIAMVGVAVWYASRVPTIARTGLLLLCLTGVTTVPFTIIWVLIQRDLWRTPVRRLSSAHSLARHREIAHDRVAAA